MQLIKALVVKLVDTKDLKSLPLAECQFESGRGHQYISNSSLKKKISIKQSKNKKTKMYLYF